MVCDNNLLAAPKGYFSRVIEALRVFCYVDFNQGLEAGRFTDWHAEQLSLLPSVKVRFAWDRLGEERAVATAVARARRAGLRDFGIYVLIGYKDAPDDALYRLETIRQWKIWPNPMRFQPLDAENKDAYVAPGWTDRELRRMMRYWSRQRWLGGVPYADYEPEDELPLLRPEGRVDR
jgi:hypothetical protein